MKTKAGSAEDSDAPTAADDAVGKAGATKVKRVRMKADNLGVDLLPDGRVVAVGLRRNGSNGLKGFLHVAASAKDLAETLRSGGIAFGKLNLCLPRHKSIARPLRLPSTEAAEISAMVGFELADAAPFSDGRTSFSFVPSGCSKDGYTDVRAFLAQDEAVREHAAMLVGAGILPDRIVVSSLALEALAMLVTAREDDAPESIIMVAADSRAMDVVAVQNGEGAYSRGVSLDSGSGDEKDLMVAEFRRSISQAREHLGGNVGRVVLAGDSELTTALARRLEESGVPASRVEGIGSFLLRTTVGVDAAGDLSAAVARAAGAAAVDFLPELAGFNLLPESLVQAKRRKAFRRELLTSGILGALVLAMVVLLIQVRITRYTGLIEALKSEIVPIKDTALAVAEKREQLRMLESHLSDSHLPLEILAEMYRLTPSGVYIIECRMHDGDVAIVGQAQSPDLAYSYPSVLMRSPAFGNVRFTGAHPVQKGKGTVTEFSCSWQAVRTPAASVEE